MDLVTAPALPRLAVEDDSGTVVGSFPVARILCVGRNYDAHAREMGGDPVREPPFFFLKPFTALPEARTVRYPAATSSQVHHEVELVLAVGARLDDADPAACREAILGCAVGLDLTRRDLQQQAKDARQPWDAGKVFADAAPCGALRRGTTVLDADAAITLDVGADRRQSGRLGDMIWAPAEVLARASVLFGLRPGDLVYTGTPAGVGPIAPGDRLAARIDGLPALDVAIV